jgi:hypothetical protein
MKANLFFTGKASRLLDQITKRTREEHKTVQGRTQNSPGRNTKQSREEHKTVQGRTQNGPGKNTKRTREEPRNLFWVLDSSKFQAVFFVF